MKGSVRPRIDRVLLMVILIFFSTPTANSQSVPLETMSGLLKLIQTIPLPTEGYMDHIAIDLRRQHLFICGEANKSIVVVDLRQGKVVHVTEGLSGNPRKPFYLPDTDEIWVDLGDGTVVAISGETYEQTKSVKLPGYGDPNRVPDGAAYDRASHFYYVGVSAAKGTKASVEIVDTQTAQHVASILLDGTDPAALALDASNNRLYVGMGDIENGMSKVEVIDIASRAVVAEWPVTGGPAPHTAGLDPPHHRLFIGSRVKRGQHQYEPGKLVVMDTKTGKVIQVLDSVGGADELQFDAPSGRIYFVGTTGTLAVFKQIDPDHYELLGKVPTGALAKTGLWVPELNRMYVAVPKHIVETPPHGASDLIIEEARLLVFDYSP
jgi:hypothetical protein